MPFMLATGRIAFPAAIFGIAVSGGAVFADPAAEARNSGFIETFDDIAWRDRWFIANFDQKGSFATGWRREHVSAILPAAPSPGEGALQLRLLPAADGADGEEAKPFFGAEVQRSGPHHYGSYEVYMRAARGEGLVSAFFTYTGPYFDNPHDEIDFEFLGRDTTRVWLNIFTDGDNLPGKWIDLGFDAANAAHLYRFEWRPDSVTWYVDDRELLRVTSDMHPIPATPGKLFLNIWAGTEAMTEWLGKPAGTATADALYHCVSYRPSGDAGRTCGDYIAEAGG